MTGSTSFGSEKGFSDKLKRLDFLAPDIGLNYRRASGVQTLFGVLLVFLASSVFVAGAVHIANRYFDTTQTNVLQEVSTSEVYPEMNLVKAKRFSSFMVFEGGRKPIPSKQVDRLFTFQSVVRRQEVEPGDRFSFQIDTIRKPLIPCSELPAEMQERVIPKDETAKMYVLSFGLCPQYNEEEFIVRGKRSDKVFHEIDIEVLPCSLVPATKCAKAETLVKMTLVHAHVEPVYNMSNYHDPVDHVWNPDDLYFFNLGLQQIIKTQLMTTQIWNDGGLLSQARQATSQVTAEKTNLMTIARSADSITCTPESVGGHQCRVYMKFQTISGGKVQKFIRSYKGAIETIGEIGGIRDIVFTAALAIYWLFHSKLTKKFMVNTIYGVKNEGYLTAQIPTLNSKEKTIAPKVLAGINQVQSPDQKQRPFESVAQSPIPIAELILPVKESSNKDKSLQDVNVRLDYDTAFDMIEDTLDVVNIVRRLQYLELWARFTMRAPDPAQTSVLESAQPSDQEMFHMTSYLMSLDAKNPMRPKRRTTSHQRLARSKPLLSTFGSGSGGSPSSSQASSGPLHTTSIFSSSPTSKSGQSTSWQQLASPTKASHHNQQQQNSQPPQQELPDWGDACGAVGESLRQHAAAYILTKTNPSPTTSSHHRAPVSPTAKQATHRQAVIEAVVKQENVPAVALIEAEPVLPIIVTEPMPSHEVPVVKAILLSPGQPRRIKPKLSVKSNHSRVSGKSEGNFA